MTAYTLQSYAELQTLQMKDICRCIPSERYTFSYSSYEEYILSCGGGDNVSACGTPIGGEVMQGDKVEELYIYNEQASSML